MIKLFKSNHMPKKSLSIENKHKFLFKTKEQDSTLDLRHVLTCLSLKNPTFSFRRHKPFSSILCTRNCRENSAFCFLNL